MSDWLEGARARTLPASVSPVFAGTGVAISMGGVNWGRAALALLIALCFQVGVNFANDYSDGIRGTDDVRMGPPRLTGGGLVPPDVVRSVAFAFFALGCVFGLWLVALCGHWWLIVIGILCLLAAWYYTGGEHPYGYMGLGEVFVFIFFGLVATAGTTYTQADGVAWTGWLMACAMGLIACAILMVNNIRDIPGDSQSGKHTLAVRLGDRRARASYGLAIGAAFILSACCIGVIGWWWILFVVSLALAVSCVRDVLGNGGRVLTGKALIPVLRNTGFVELGFGLAALAAFGLATL